MALRALARVNLAAVQRNVVRLRRELTAGAALCAVVKADGYGHGAVPAARAALAGGATWLAVATANEAAELRAAGVEQRILVMGAIGAQELPVALAAQADVVAWSEPFVTDILASRGPGAASATRVHVKLDTGMGRLGTRDPSEGLRLATRIADAAPELELAGAMTHFATADGDPDFLAAQLGAFAPFVAQMRERHPGIVVHAANSAAVLNQRSSHFDMVRCGVAIYGLDPMQEDAVARELEPALELTSYLAAVKPVRAGDSVGYGRQFIAEHETVIGTLPIGYADGIRRAFTNNCDVLVDGSRRPLVGTVSMDNITIDLGAGADNQPGQRATIIGRDGSERQTAEQLAARIETINYEIVCGISARVPRSYHRDGVPVADD